MRTRLAIILTLLLAGTACTSTVNGHGGGTGGATGPSGTQQAGNHLRALWTTPGVGGASGTEQQLEPGDADAARAYVSDVSGHVTALDAQTGKPVWHARPGTRSGTGVGVAGDRVLYFDSNAGIYALDAANGRVVWHKQPVDPITGDRYRPAVAGGIVAIQHDHVVSGVRLATGTVAWSTPDSLWSTDALPASDGKLVFTASWTKPEGPITISARRPTDGKAVWQAAAGASPGGDSNLFALGDVLVYAYQDSPTGKTLNLRGYAAASGHELWQAKVPQVLAISNAYATQGVGLFDSQDGLIGVDLRTGKIRFTSKVEGGGPLAIGVCGTAPCAFGLSDITVFGLDGSTVQQVRIPGEDASGLFTGAAGSVYVTTGGSVIRYR